MRDLQRDSKGQLINQISLKKNFSTEKFTISFGISWAGITIDAVVILVYV